MLVPLLLLGSGGTAACECAPRGDEVLCGVSAGEDIGVGGTGALPSAGCCRCAPPAPFETLLPRV